MKTHQYEGHDQEVATVCSQTLRIRVGGQRLIQETKFETRRSRTQVSGLETWVKHFGFDEGVNVSRRTTWLLFESRRCTLIAIIVEPETLIKDTRRHSE